MKWRSLEESSSETDARPLLEIFAERKELIAKYVPAEAQAIHAQAVAELKERRLAANILPVGAKAPAFELPDHDGKIVSSSELLERGPVVICFIRGMVSVLCGTNGGHEPRSAADRAGWSDACCYITADG